MAKQIQKTDLVEDNILEGLQKELQETRSETEALEHSLLAVNTALESIQSSAAKSKGGFAGLDRKKVDDLAKHNKLTKEAHKLAKEDEVLKKTKIQTESALETKRQKEIRTQILLRKEEERIAKAHKKTAKAVADEANEYKKLEKETRNQKNESVK